MQMKCECEWLAGRLLSTIWKEISALYISQGYSEATWHRRRLFERSEKRNSQKMVAAWKIMGDARGNAVDIQSNKSVQQTRTRGT